MQSIIFRIACLGAALLAPAWVSVSATEPVSQISAAGSAQFKAKISFRDGTTLTGRLQGIGCSQNLCSRTAIRGQDASHRRVTSPFDSLAAIKDTTADAALFLSKDGTRRRLSLLKDYRVLYLQTQSGATEKLDLEAITAVEFIPVHR